MVVVGDDGLLLAVDDCRRQVDVFQFPADPVPQHRHENGLGVSHVEIEPIRVLRLRAAAQHVPQGAVVPQGSGDRHVVGHHVDDDAHTQLVGCLREPPESVLPSALFRDPRVVHDVVAVGGLRCRLQDRRAEQVGDAERVQVWQPRAARRGEPSVPAALR